MGKPEYDCQVGWNNNYSGSLEVRQKIQPFQCIDNSLTRTCAIQHQKEFINFAVQIDFLRDKVVRELRDGFGDHIELSCPTAGLSYGDI